METEAAMYPGAKYLCEKLELRKMTSYTSDTTVSYPPLKSFPKTITNAHFPFLNFRNTSSLRSSIWTRLPFKALNITFLIFLVNLLVSKVPAIGKYFLFSCPIFQLVLTLIYFYRGNNCYNGCKGVRCGDLDYFREVGTNDESPI